jgi:integrase
MKSTRNHSDAHPGVSVVNLGDGRHRLRWRERTASGGSVSQSWTVAGSPAEAEIAAIDVYGQLMTKGTFVRPVDGPAPPRPTRPEVATLEDLFVAFSAWRLHVVGARGSTGASITGALVTFEAALRAVTDRPDGPLPVTLLTAAHCEAVVRRLKSVPGPSPAGRVRQDGSPARPSKRRRAPPGEGRINQIMRYVYAAWEWGADEPDRWPGLAPAPRVKRKIVPPAPVPSAALVPPTWREMDLVVHAARALRRPESADVGDILEIARGTGLRVGQVIGLVVGDFGGLDTPVPTVRVRPELGKSRRERQGRTVPIAPVLVPLVRRLVEGKEPGQALFARSKPINVYTLRAILERATAQGLRTEVYRSSERGNERITHFMRAGFQHGLRREGVAERTIDRLVGHNPASTRDAHYAPAELEDLVAAVRRVPAVSAPAERGSDVGSGQVLPFPAKAALTAE